MYAAQHCPHSFQWYCYVWAVAVRFRDMFRSKHEMNTVQTEGAVCGIEREKKKKRALRTLKLAVFLQAADLSWRTRDVSSPSWLTVSLEGVTGDFL